MTVPTPAQIRAQVRSVRIKDPGARVIGLRVRGKLDLASPLRVNGDELPVACCDSVLAVRERLTDLPEEGTPLVLLTSLSGKDLGADVLARLARQELVEIQPWLLVREMFRARYIDPRICERHPWVAEALLEAESEGSFEPVPTGFLDAERVWSEVFRAWLGLPDGSRDAETLLEWSLETEHRERIRALPDEVREGLREAVRESAGVLAGEVFDCLAGPHAELALPIGLVVPLLLERAPADEAAVRALVRLERFLGDRPVERDTALAWAAATELVVRRRLDDQGLESLRPVLELADRLLGELGAPASAESSRYLPKGHELRLEGFAKALERSLDAKRGPETGPTWEHVHRVSRHVVAEHDPQTTVHIHMAARLAAWVGAAQGPKGSKPKSLPSSAEDYRANGAFVDWARAKLRSAPSSGPLATAYSRLLEVADGIREEENRRFSELLMEWTRSGSTAPSLIPVESVLRQVVAPLARVSPVLLLVVDGMAAAVHRELQQDLLSRGWAELVADSGTGRPSVLAALPTVTQVSRASLFCGKLVAGQAAHEVDGFAKQTDLAQASEPSRPPVLFHKAALVDGGGVGVASRVLDEIGDGRRRVVGVVVNAVDDLLSRGDQIRVDWTCHGIRPLEELLSAAWAAQRIVVMVSDHGHVLEWGTKSREGEGERWREASRPPEDGEVLLEGPRVLLGTDQRVVAPWTEGLRYGGKKAGYHGGATPQEVVIPLGIYAQAGLLPEGWIEAAPEAPDWWVSPDARVELKPTERVSPPRLKKKGQGELFVEPAAKDAVATPAGWVDRLLASPVYMEQHERAQRTALRPERLRAILLALDARGGKLTRSALVRALEVPPLRIGPILSALRRLLNVDGFPVVSVDEASDTVELSRELLEKQFGLTGEDPE